MGRKTLTAALVSLVLLLTISVPRWPALGAVGLNLNEPDGATTTTEQTKKGNSLGRALSAPFRALSRLFGGGKKRNQRPEKLTQKDIAKFESAPPVNRVNDARPTTPPTASAGDNSASEHLQKGRDFLNAGKLNEAIAELSLAASLDSASGEAHTLLGVAYDRKGLRDLAQQSFETALHAPDDQAMHLNNLGYLFYKNGEYDEAIKHLKRSVKINSEDKRVWNNLGMAQCGVGKFDDCYKSFARASGEFQARLKVAAYLERQDFSKEAIKQLEKARKLKTDSLELWSRLAVLYDSVGRSADANQARASVSALRTVAVAPNQ